MNMHRNQKQIFVHVQTSASSGNRTRDDTHHYKCGYFYFYKFYYYRIDIWIEDKEATRGPVRLTVSRKAVLGELKQEAEKSLGLQIRLQRWIIGKTLCSNDSISLITLAGPDLTAPFYLCLVDFGL